MNYANLVWFMTTSNLTQRQLKWAEKLAEYDFKITYWEGKKNSADDLLRQSDYELLKAASTLTAAEIVWQFFCLRSKNYKSVQKELYTLAAMMLQSRHSVWQLWQDDVIISTANTEDDSVTQTSAVYDLHTQKACCNKYDTDTLKTEDSDMTETSVIHYLHAHKASCNESNESVMSDLKNDDMTETSVICDLHAQEASCDKCDTSMTNTEDSSVTETSAVCDSYAQKASCDEYNISIFITEDSDMIETSAVHDQYAQWASCNENDKSVMSEDSDTTETSAVHD